MPLSPVDPNALISYHSSFGALRQLKGFAWALALLPWLIAESHDLRQMDRRFIAGMLVGLCAVVATAVWERMAFAGLLDFAGEYRVEGPFPELHTGGGDIHAYLATALPFVVAWIALRPSGIRIASGATLLVLASYALAVTFTRGGYVGYFGAMGVLGIATAIQGLRSRARKLGQIAIAALLAAASVAVMLPIVSGSFMESRLAGTQSEAAMRTGHWARTVAMMDTGAATALFGMGLGSFPRTFLFNNPDLASATFSYEREGEGQFVRLGSGRPLFLGQRVDIAAGLNYTLSLDIRSAAPKSALGVSLCEKSVQYSFRCEELGIQVKTGGSQWEHHEVAFNSGEIGSGPWLLRRPVVVSLANAQPASRIDVDNVRLLDERGRDLVANGDFSRWRGAMVLHGRRPFAVAHIQSLGPGSFRTGMDRCAGLRGRGCDVARAPWCGNVEGRLVLRSAACVALRISADRHHRKPVRRAARGHAVLLVVVRGVVAPDRRPKGPLTGGNVAAHRRVVGARGRPAMNVRTSPLPSMTDGSSPSRRTA